MAQNQPVGVPFQNPTRYVGPHMDVVPIKRFPRRPLTSDKKYRIGHMAILGKEPTTGVEGELWYLSHFEMTGEAIWVQITAGSSEPAIDSITTDDGSPPVLPDVSGNVNILGGIGVDVNGNGPDNTITISTDGNVVATQYDGNTGSAFPLLGVLQIIGTGGISTDASGNTITITQDTTGFTWNTITDSTETLVANNGYFANAAGGVTFSLPTICLVGDTFIVSSINSGGWTIAQNAGQSIQLGNSTTSTGIIGSLSSTDIGDTVTIVCSSLDQNFQVINSMGNITLV